jgi:hypothetical protein
MRRDWASVALGLLLPLLAAAQSLPDFEKRVH